MVLHNKPGHNKPGQNFITPRLPPSLFANHVKIQSNQKMCTLIIHTVLFLQEIKKQDLGWLASIEKKKWLIHSCKKIPHLIMNNTVILKVLYYYHETQVGVNKLSIRTLLKKT